MGVDISIFFDRIQKDAESSVGPDRRDQANFLVGYLKSIITEHLTGHSSIEDHYNILMRRENLCRGDTTKQDIV